MLFDAGTLFFPMQAPASYTCQLDVLPDVLVSKQCWCLMSQTVLTAQ